MPSSACRGCTKRLPDNNAGVCIFQDTSVKKEQNSVKAGIELITGVAVSDSDGLPRRLCTECNNKLEEFLAFRTQLLNSLRIFRSAGQTSSRSEPTLEVVNSSPTLNTARSNPNKLVIQEELRISDLKTEFKHEPMVGSSNGLSRIHVVEEDGEESDIDVCSGEDDGVLELDVQSRKDVIYEIESSGESDILVCDYEPNGL